MKKLFIIMGVILFAMACSTVFYLSTINTIDYNWQEPIAITYKDSPDRHLLDKPEYVDMIKGKTECSPYRNYPLSGILLQLLSLKGDPTASYLLDKKDNYMAIFSDIVGQNISNEEKLNQLSQYDHLTPYAYWYKDLLYLKVKTEIEKGKSNDNEMEFFDMIGISDRLIQAGGEHYFLMVTGLTRKLKIDVELSDGEKELFCELYYRGCKSLYKSKTEYNIKCGE